MKGIQFKAIAINKQAKKLNLSAIIFSETATTVAVFTQNIFCAAPVIVAKNHIANNIKAIIINSGNANAGTGIAAGDIGVLNATYICQLLAQELSCKTKYILPCSTGVIGQQLLIKDFEQAMPKLVQQSSTLEDVATAITTTDTFIKIVKKQVTINNKIVNIVGIAKGSGMICPNMATMLSFIFTDIIADKKTLQQCLNIAVNQSFNRITVDGDTSTNDTTTLSTTGNSGVDIDNITGIFQQELNLVTRELALKIIADGEGATKIVTIIVTGAKNNNDCLQVAYTVAHSPLVKTAIFASDANWGRILAAIGRSNISPLNKKDIDIYLDDVCVIKNGKLSDKYTEKAGSSVMSKKEIIIAIKVGNYHTKEIIWTTDLSYDYIKINAEYRS